MDPSHDTPSSHGMNTPGSNDAAAARDPRAVVPFVPSDDAASGARPPESIGSWVVRNGLVLLVLALLLWFCIAQGFVPEKIFALAKVVLGLGLVIFIHELGHFLVAKWCDVHVETFSIGFGPPIPGCVFRRGETTYMIALFPLGGYVKMVGEGPEEESEDDPRSFKNKPVWQRMAIISAGVTMNVLLAFVFFVYVFLTHGAARWPGVIDHVEPGSPAWVEGMRSGDVIYWYGNKGPRPYFNDILPVTMNSKKDEPIQIAFGPPGLPEEKWHRDTIVARREKEDSRPVIGIVPAYQLKLFAGKMRKGPELPAYYHSAAAKAAPAFQFDDLIVGTSDPQDLDQVIPLPLDPRCIPEDPDHFDYFEFRRRLHQMAGKEITIQVRRKNFAEPINIRVPPAYTWTLGMQMPMGKITAVRKGSPAEKADLDPNHYDYSIEKLKLTDASGQSIEYPGEIKDPLRLPDALERWAANHTGQKTATLVLGKSVVNPPASSSEPGNHPALEHITLTLPWEDGWYDGNEGSVSLSTPVAIGGLGIAYRVNTTVESVEAGSPAEKAGVLKNDKIVGFRFFEAGKKVTDEAKPHKSWTDLKPDQWAAVFNQLQYVDIPSLQVRVEREDGSTHEITIEAKEDKDWPRDDRGLLFQPDQRLQKADNLGQALAMGVNETWNFTSQIFGNLRAIVTGRVSVGNVMGPLGIAQTAFGLAGEDFNQFLIFLGIIGVNLAVINFLPIPVLDGGHMVFLIYEWIRGKPAPETVRVAATYVGLAAILSLMVLVIYLDVRRNWG
ncbi:MAG TPA: site-2 protease family protein [Gemmataceae bacterium]|nr:site-2 protease family protein [Gemmataceae bacterium]